MTLGPPERDLLTALGHVDPPPPGVLAAAREVLWSAVAQQMLAADPVSTQSAGAADADSSAPSTERHPSHPPQMGRSRPADRPLPTDPDA
jgi:hypothetical protein